MSRYITGKDIRLEFQSAKLTTTDDPVLEDFLKGLPGRICSRPYLHDADLIKGLLSLAGEEQIRASESQDARRLALVQETFCKIGENDIKYEKRKTPCFLRDEALTYVQSIAGGDIAANAKVQTQAQRLLCSFAKRWPTRVDSLFVGVLEKILILWHNDAQKEALKTGTKLLPEVPEAAEALSAIAEGNLGEITAATRTILNLIAENKAYREKYPETCKAAEAASAKIREQDALPKAAKPNRNALLALFFPDSKAEPL